MSWKSHLGAERVEVGAFVEHVDTFAPLQRAHHKISCRGQRGLPRDLHRPVRRQDEQHLFGFPDAEERSEEHTSELQSLMRISYAVFCLKKKTNTTRPKHNTRTQTYQN